jgi:nucleotide-binding universal stress UspA family protein
MEDFMSYKTVLVHADNSRTAETRLRLAADIAANQGAHLVGAACVGTARMIDGVESLAYASPELAGQFTALTAGLRTRAEEALESFGRIARNADVRSYETLLINDEAAAGLGLRARYADLAVISQFDPDSASSLITADFPETVVLNSGCPTLILPYAGNFKHVGARPLVAWDGGAAATRAVRDALPFLRKAKSVDVVVFNPHKSGGTHGQQAGDDIALFLSRHDVKVEVHRETTTFDIGNALLSKTADLGSDMVVMGCYGHSRFREILLGGVTRTVLQTMTVPVLMSR